MANLVVWRFSIILTTLAAMIAGLLAYGNLAFPYNYAVIAVAVAAICAHGYFINHKEKTARLEAFYATVRDFGTPVSFGNHDASFERNGTVFDAEFPRDEDNTCFIVRFSIPGIYEKFIIQHREIFTKSIDGCELLEPSPLEGHFIVRSKNAEFLLNLLKNKTILDEIYDYPDTLLGRFAISFDAGDFEIEWTPKLNEQIDGFNKVSKTAVVFHDELKKLAETSGR